MHVSLADEDAVAGAVYELAQHVRIDRVECLWEPYMILAARLREMLGAAGADGASRRSRSATRSG